MGTSLFRSAVASAALLGTAFVVVSAPALASESVPGEYVVQLKHSRSLLSARQISKALGAEVKSLIRKDMVVIKKDFTRNPTQVVRELSANPVVEFVEPNYIYRISKTPNDTSYGKLWGLSNNGSVDSVGHVGVAGMDINAEKAWDITTGTKNTVVAVIDTGIDLSHPELKNNAWTNQAELNGKAGVDDDSNGYVDDIHGYDFNKNTGDVVDENGHGTHCAGTIGGEGGNGAGVAGVNWHVRLMAVRFLGADGSGTLENAIKGIDYARKNGAHVMSNSWGGGSYSAAMEKAIQDANDAGVVFVAAAGNSTNNNDTNPSFPASYHIDNVISVAAVDNSGQLASFSNFGAASVHVAAPGVHIYSLAPNGLYKDLSGTSMATPHVSGVAALVIGNDYCAGASCTRFSPKDIRDRLIQTSRPLASLNGAVAANGMVDAYAALTNQKPPPDANDPSNWQSQATVSVSTPHPYANAVQYTYDVNVPGAKKIAIHFQKFETEALYDNVKVYDGSGTLLGTLNGVQTGRYSPVYSTDTVKLVFEPDATLPGYGFDVDFVKYQ